MSEKEDRWPKGGQNGFFRGPEKGTPDYRIEMAKKRVQAGEYKERRSEGPLRGPIYRFKSRYSNYNPFRAGSEDSLQTAIKEEVEIYQAALAGSHGLEMKGLAEKYGLHGIAEVVDLTPAGLIVRDILNSSAPEELFVRPDEDVSGLWDIQSDWENPNADRRVKGNWTLEPFWPKGTRFVLRRNVSALNMKVDVLEDALAALNEPGSKATVEERERQALKIKAKLADKAGLLYESGFEIRKAGEHGFVPMGDMPEGFDRDLRSVSIDSAKDAFDLVNFEAHNLREVLEYLVDAVNKTVPWHLANLLEQSVERLGYFEPIPGIDFEEGEK